MLCKTCGEVMSGDGYTTALHCPDVDASDREPDAAPLHCQARGPAMHILGDKALVKLLPVATRTAGGLVLPEMYVGNRLSQFGEIIALGDGRNPEGKVGDWDVEVGQVVALGEWVNRPFLWDGVEYHLVYQHEILGEVIGLEEDATL